MESHGIGQSGAKKIKWAVILIQNTLINFFIQYRRPRYLFFLCFCGCCTALVYLLKENSYNNLRAWNFLVLLFLKTSHLSWEFCSHSPNVPETFFFFYWILIPEVLTCSGNLQMLPIPSNDCAGKLCISFIIKLHYRNLAPVKTCV